MEIINGLRSHQQSDVEVVRITHHSSLITYPSIRSPFQHTILSFPLVFPVSSSYDASIHCGTLFLHGLDTHCRARWRLVKASSKAFHRSLVLVSTGELSSMEVAQTHGIGEKDEPEHINIHSEAQGCEVGKSDGDDDRMVGASTSASMPMTQQLKL
jgi:hypothetical protein